MAAKEVGSFPAEHRKMGASAFSQDSTSMLPRRPVSQHWQREAPEAVISIVTAFFNEELTISAFFRALDEIAPALECHVEFVCVNDGSRDRTLELLHEELNRGRQIRIVNLARNFGKEAAISAGLAHANGNAVVVIDADLQDPPSLIPEFVKKWREGYDVAYGIRACRESDSVAKRVSARWFYRVFDLLTEIRIPSGAGDFRLLDRRVVDALLSLPERNRYMKGLYAWVGFRQTGIEYVRLRRVGGKSGWSFVQLLNLAVDAFTSFSSAPLRVAGVAGFAVSIAGFGYATFLIARTLFFGTDVPGYASLMVTIMFLGGVQLFCVGVLGEYVGRLYTEAKARPLYIVADVALAPHSLGTLPANGSDNVGDSDEDAPPRYGPPPPPPPDADEGADDDDNPE
jgi:glycosyltransferase involved in cell wall biosynthesis